MPQLSTARTFEEIMGEGGLNQRASQRLQLYFGRMLMSSILIYRVVLIQLNMCIMNPIYFGMNSSRRTPPFTD